MTETERRADPVREFLRSGLEARLEVRRHQRRTEELESRCTRLVAQMTGMPAGGGSGLEATWAALADERREEQRLVQEELDQYHAVERFIAQLGDPVCRTVLRLRYLEGKPEEKVVPALYICRSTYYRKELEVLSTVAVEAARRGLL